MGKKLRTLLTVMFLENLTRFGVSKASLLLVQFSGHLEDWALDGIICDVPSVCGFPRGGGSFSLVVEFVSICAKKIELNMI